MFMCGRQPDPPDSWKDLPPGWRLHYCSNQQVHDMLASAGWDIKLLQARHPVQWADIWRWQVMDWYGGIYFDRDTEPFDFDRLSHIAMADRPCVVGHVDCLEQWAIAAPSRSIFVSSVNHEIRERVRKGKPPRSAGQVLIETGWQAVRAVIEAQCQRDSMCWPFILPHAAWGVRHIGNDGRWRREITSWSAPK